MKKYLYITLFLVLAIILTLIMTGRTPNEEKALAKAAANKEKIVALLRSTGRPQMEAVISYLDTTAFYTMGASNHHNYTGGLAQHSLEVYRIMKLLTWFQSSDNVIISAIFHDMGKITWGWHPYRATLILNNLDFHLTEREYITIIRHHRQRLVYYRDPLRRALTMADALSAGWWILRHPFHKTVEAVPSGNGPEQEDLQP